ncbi:MAG: glycosyltransferase family 8 protein [Oscillospiraceae bacterium]|nr:glycosyltransferase family 8 protein [Oscillospiraceae bacterium]
MNIVMATSNLYSHPALITIRSLLTNNADADELTIHYIENGISEDNKKMLSELAESFGRRIIFYPLPEGLKGIKGLSRTDPVVYSYCFLQEILPDTVDRALLLEGDCIVAGSLKEFYSIDLTGFCLAASDDCQSKWYKRKLGLKDDSVYHNSGMMLFNLDELRRIGFGDRIRAVIEEGKSKFFYEVQDELNVALEGKIKTIPPRFNCTTALFLFDYKNMLLYRRPSTVYSEEEFLTAREHPVVIHFTKNQIIQARPWIKDCVHPYNDLYLRIKADTVLKDEPLWEHGRGKINRLAYLMYSRMPKAFTAWGLGIVHAFLYPVFLYRIMMKK